MSSPKVGDIVRWAWTGDPERSDHLLVLGIKYLEIANGYYLSVIELESGIRSDTTWRLEATGGHWELVA